MLGPRGETWVRLKLVAGRRPPCGTAVALEGAASDAFEDAGCGSEGVDLYGLKGVGDTPLLCRSCVTARAGDELEVRILEG